MLGRYRAAGALIFFLVVPAAILSASCAVNEIVPQCKDGMKNGDETDVDCGGTCTNRCPDDKACVQHGDCASGACSPCTKAGCTGSVCSMPRCDDHVANGTETDTDCGGSCIDKCADGKECSAGSDCTSTFCSKGVCVAQCTSAAKDGSETDIDCGG
jgi:hypothetical protein